MTNITILTGIKPTGIPHLGNYLGAIQPALLLANNHPEQKKLFFIADYHALTTVKDRQLMRQYRYIVAATWLAFFEGVPNCHFYFQSHIPEIFELYWMLSCVCPKGLLNRAHAYKALVSKNMALDRDPDDQINHGIFAYPVLMAADILLFRATHIPVGKDQMQHVEIAVDIVEQLNRYLDDPIPIPQPMISESTDVIIGTDGQKMSKNYNNTIPLFEDDALLKKVIMRIQTDSVPMGQPLNPESCNVFKLLSYFLNSDALNHVRSDYKSGAIGYGHAKQTLLATLTEFFESYNNRYRQFLSNTSKIDAACDPSPLREIATPHLQTIKHQLGF